MTHKILLYFSLVFMLLIGFGFIKTKPSFILTEDDVKLIYPKYFPPPIQKTENDKDLSRIFLLGRKLFFDPILSLDSSISCGSCHQQFAAFAHSDHAFSFGVAGHLGTRSSPALQNLIWKDTYMYDGRIHSLDSVALVFIENPEIMGENLPHVLNKLQRNSAYKILFKQAFGDSMITSTYLLKSIRQYLSLLISDHSHYDRYLNHTDSFSSSEKKGLKIFRAHCASCHKEPLFTDNSYRNIGIPMSHYIKDSGRAQLTGVKTDYLKFKVPSLRNIEVSDPYMHDGRYHNLDDVIDFYCQAKFKENNVDPLIKNGIKLSEEDKSNLLDFLATLTDDYFLHDQRFRNPHLPRRPDRNTNNPEINFMKASESELVHFFKSTWDSTKLQQKENLPQYRSYLDSLLEIPSRIAVLIHKRSEKMDKLEDLRKSLLSSKKYKDAIKNFFALGQPVNEDAIVRVCLNYLLKNDSLNSVGQIKSKKIIGVSDKGWLVRISLAEKVRLSSVQNIFTFQVLYRPIENDFYPVLLKN